MSTYVSIDHPDEVVHWFACYPQAQRERPVIGDCPHECEHRAYSVVAYGPNLEHYELVVCDDDGCAGNCRAWLATDDNPRGTGGPRYRESVHNPAMKQLAPMEPLTTA